MTPSYLTMNPFGFPILSTVTFLPLVGVLVLFFLKDDLKIKLTALVASLLTLAVSLVLFFNFDQKTPVFQFAEKLPWIPAYNINYVLGVDGISIMLIVLTALIAPLCVLCSWKAIDKRVKAGSPRPCPSLPHPPCLKHPRPACRQPSMSCPSRASLP